MKIAGNVMWDELGPYLEITNQGGDPEFQYVLNIQDVNPSCNFNWCFSRWEMVRIGVWFVWQALTARKEPK